MNLKSGVENVGRLLKLCFVWLIGSLYFTISYLIFIQVVEMTRFIELSHWGNIAVEESFTLKHVGALLKVIPIILLI